MRKKEEKCYICNEPLDRENNIIGIYKWRYLHRKVHLSCFTEGRKKRIDIEILITKSMVFVLYIGLLLTTLPFIFYKYHDILGFTISFFVILCIIMIIIFSIRIGFVWNEKKRTESEKNEKKS